MENDIYFPNTNNPQDIINCELTQEGKSVYIDSFDSIGNLLHRIGFSSKEDPTSVGLEIIKSGLVATIIGKFRSAISINLNFELDDISFNFLKNLKENVIEDLKDSNNTILNIKRLTKSKVDKVISVPNTALQGYSNGRDSYTSSKILDEIGIKYKKYNIEYDKEKPLHGNYSTFEFDSPFVQKSNIPYEPFDIPLTYFAPFWGVKDRFPEYLSVGHSFDVLGYESNDRLAPYESPEAIKIHEKYIEDILGTKIEFLFPLSSMSTYSNFEYIRRKYGIDELEKRHSCWNNSKSDCGYCEKCQRIKLASSGLHNENYKLLPFVNQVIDNDSYLLGNPIYDKLVNQYGRDNLSEAQIFIENGLNNDKISEHLYKRFSKKYYSIDIDEVNNPQPKEFQKNKLDMIQDLEINYDELSQTRYNDSKKLLPFEEYFDRDIPVLSCYGEIPVFSDKYGWDLIRISDGPTLNVPDTELFRRFFKK